MPHLNEINQKFGSRGLKIVAVSDEQGDTIEKRGVLGLGMNYGVARSARAVQLYGVRGIPHAFMIGKDGKVLWHGYPGDIDDAMLEAWLGGQPLPAGAPPSAEGSNVSSAFLKLGTFFLLSGIVVFLVLRGMKPKVAPEPVAMRHAMPPVPGAPAQGGPPAPPQQAANCKHCGAPRREGRKICMSCGAPL